MQFNVDFFFLLCHTCYLETYVPQFGKRFLYHFRHNFLHFAFIVLHFYNPISKTEYSKPPFWFYFPLVFLDYYLKYFFDFIIQYFNIFHFDQSIFFNLGRLFVISMYLFSFCWLNQYVLFIQLRIPLKDVFRCFSYSHPLLTDSCFFFFLLGRKLFSKVF